MRNKELLIKLSFYIYLLTDIIFVLFMFFHWDGAFEVIAFGILFYLIFVVSSISEILNIQKLSKSEKNMWINGLILLA
jgi:uncharacterized membrane protein